MLDNEKIADFTEYSVSKLFLLTAKDKKESPEALS